MYGSTDITRLRTSNCPGPGSASSVVTSWKFDGLGSPCGRDARWISRATVGMSAAPHVPMGGQPVGRHDPRARERRYLPRRGRPRVGPTGGQEVIGTAEVVIRGTRFVDSDELLSCPQNGNAEQLLSIVSELKNHVVNSASPE